MRDSCTSGGGGWEQVYTVQGTPGQTGEEEEGAGIHCTRDSWKSREEEEGSGYSLYNELLDMPGRRKGAGIHCTSDSWTSRGGGGRSRYTLYERLLDKPGRRRKEQVYTP